MRTVPSTPHGSASNRSTIVAVMALATLILVASAGSSFAQEPEALRIEITLDEYSFSPNPLLIPAGREVTLVIRNAGRVGHEFMAGRDPEGNDFKQDLFAGLHVNIEQVEGSDPDQAQPTDANHAEQSADEHHANGEGHAHGTMVEAQAGQTFVMTFTLPEERRGEWTTGCFLPGHYEAGMHGALIVE